MLRLQVGRAAAVAAAARDAQGASGARRIRFKVTIKDPSGVATLGLTGGQLLGGVFTDIASGRRFGSYYGYKG